MREGGREGGREGLTAELNLVLIIPGARQLTLIAGANSAARALVRPSRAVLLVEYGPNPCGIYYIINILYIVTSILGHLTENGCNPPIEDTITIDAFLRISHDSHMTTHTRSHDNTHSLCLRYGTASFTSSAVHLTFTSRI